LLSRVPFAWIRNDNQQRQCGELIWRIRYAISDTVFFAVEFVVEFSIFGDSGNFWRERNLKQIHQREKSAAVRVRDLTLKRIISGILLELLDQAWRAVGVVQWNILIGTVVFIPIGDLIFQTV